MATASRVELPVIWNQFHTDLPPEDAGTDDVLQWIRSWKGSIGYEDADENDAGMPTYEELDRLFTRISWTGQNIRILTQKEMEYAFLRWGFPKQIADGISVDIQLAKDFSRSGSSGIMVGSVVVKSEKPIPKEIVGNGLSKGVGSGDEVCYYGLL